MAKDQRPAGTALAGLILAAAEKGALRRAVLSKPRDAGVMRAELRPVTLSRGRALQLELFTADNKAYQRNIMLPADTSGLESIIAGYRQINVMTAVGDCEYRSSKSGNSVLLGGDKLSVALEDCERCESATETNDRRKAHILTGDEPFLKLLGVSDANGRVYDKKQSKFQRL